jgi:broad specificity phosphatase PhoE
MLQVPSNLQKYLDDIKVKLADFEAKLTFDEVINWVLQFAEKDQTLAIKLFLSLKYFNFGEVTRLCKALYAYIPETVRTDHVKFVGLGTAADSGGMLMYHYRVNNNIPESSFTTVDGLREQLSLGYASQDKLQRLIFLDDFIGTGGQAIELLSRELKEILVKGNFQYVGLHALVGFAESVKRIKKETGVDVLVAHTLTDKDKVFHEASDMLTDDYFDRQNMKDTMTDYGHHLYPIGPLGYGGTQALIAFFYNTPNNTLPVIWARSDRWMPLLPRAETKNVYDALESEKLAVTYLHSIGGRCKVGDIQHLADSLELRGDALIDTLAARHIISVDDDDFVQHINLTAKGTREALDLFAREKNESRGRLAVCRRHLIENLPENPRASEKDYARLLASREELISMLSIACIIKDVATVLALRKTVSWLLLMEHAYEERVRLGTLIIDSFSPEALGVEWGLIKIDDLGWSHVACNRLDVASQNILDGVRYLWDRDHIFGVCQGWRHLQAIKARRGQVEEAELGLRLVFGASCAIPTVGERLEMQAGIARGLANVSARRGRFEASQFYEKLAGSLSEESGNKMHSTPTSRSPYMSGNAKVLRTSLNRKTRLYAIRHPLTKKNQKEMFGRHPGILPETGKEQLKGIASRLVANLGAIPNSDIQIYSSEAKSACVLAEQIADQVQRPVEVTASLDSIDSGELTGLTEFDAQEMFPEIMHDLRLYRENQMDGYVLEFPGGESVRNLTMRVARFLLETVYVASTFRVVVIVGHNSSITAVLNIISALDRNPLHSSYLYHDVPVGSVTRISYDFDEAKVLINMVV